MNDTQDKDVLRADGGFLSQKLGIASCPPPDVQAASWRKACRVSQNSSQILVQN